MAISKVIFNDETQIDITDTTATADKILTSYGAYGADGVWMSGSATAGSGSGLVTLASGSFTGNDNSDSTAGSGRQLINIGKKMAQTDFWVFLRVANGTEFTYSSNRQFVWFSMTARHEFGSYDLSSTGHKSFTAIYTIDSNNEGTITTRTPGDLISNGKQIYNGSISVVTPNTLSIWRESDHFEICVGLSNSAYRFPAKTYTYEVVYFGSNPSTDIIEIT